VIVLSRLTRGAHLLLSFAHSQICALLKLWSLCAKSKFALADLLSSAPTKSAVRVQDKAVKRFMVRNMVETAAIRDLQDASAIEGLCSWSRVVGEISLMSRCLSTTRSDYRLPKFYIKMQYCISCAVHAHIVRVRSADARKIR
jgi:ribosomal protein S26